MTVPSDLASPPPADTEVPLGLRAALDSLGLARAHLRPVWRNSVGGLTFSVASGGHAAPIDFYAKWNPAESGESLAEEAERMRWIHGRHPVPAVIDVITSEVEEVLISRALPGESAVSERWKSRPDAALWALGVGLRRLHDIPLEDCPFDWGIEHRMRVNEAGTVDIGAVPRTDKLVLCQGDPCAPNTLLAADGSFLAHVDLARLGAADRWADLAVMSMSLGWNYRDYDESIFWDAYGIDPDPVRIDFYRRLWNAT